MAFKLLKAENICNQDHHHCKFRPSKLLNEICKIGPSQTEKEKGGEEPKVKRKVSIQLKYRFKT